MPSDKMGLRFVRKLSENIRGVQASRWDTERFIIFRAVILQHVCHVNASHTIRRSIGKRFYAWEYGQHQILF